jgi:uncharacterized protein (TIGR00255 family)
MIKSMTAYAANEQTTKDLTVSIEIRTYNSRFLDVVLKLPHGFAGFEKRIKSTINDHITRGRVEIRMQVADTSEAVGAYQVDWAKAKGLHQILTELQDTFKLDTPITYKPFLTMNGIIIPAESGRDLEADWPIIEAGLKQAASDLEEMRTKEGAFIEADFKTRIEYLAQILDEVEQTTADVLAYYQQKLTERIKVLTQDKVDLDPNRIAQEAAILADKSDITEEITRVKSHIQQFMATMEGREPAGRKLNFLLQEFMREFNTIGSKTANTDVSHLIVSAKAELEKLREQIQNIE